MLWFYLPAMAEQGGITTGLAALDRLLFGDEYYRENGDAGFRSGEVVLIRGEPGSGKTTLGLHIASNFLRKRRSANEGVRFMTLEEPARAMERRCDKYGFPPGKFTWVQRREIDTIVEEFCRTTNPEGVVEGWTKGVGDAVEKSGELIGGPAEVIAIAVAPLIERLFKKVLAKLVGPRDDQPPNERPRLVIIDSLNALMNLLIKADPKERPRLLFNSFCQVLRREYGPDGENRDSNGDATAPAPEAPVIIIIGEHHFNEPSTDKHLPESFFCDTEIVLRPEPVRVPRDSDAAAKMTVGYDLAAIVDRDARHLESRSFCRVLKARNSPRQSRRCAYDIEAGQGFRFFETYPGDGKLMLFGENEQQRSSWNSFFHRDLTDAYPALRYETFTMAGLETVYESSRRLLQVPLRTDMFLSSLDSYWVTGYRDYRLKTKINERLQAKMKRVAPWTLIESNYQRKKRPKTLPEQRPARSPISAWACVDYPSLVNELVYYALCSQHSKIYDGTRNELSRRPGPVRHDRSQRHEKRIEDLGKSSKTLGTDLEALANRIRTRYDKLCQYLFGTTADKILKDSEIIPASPLQDTFLRPLPRSQLTLFGQYNADVLPQLMREEMHQFEDSEDYWLSIPYDANIGVFTARLDLLRPALEKADVSDYERHYRILKDQEIRVLEKARDRADVLLGDPEPSKHAALKTKIDAAIATCRAERDAPPKLPTFDALVVTRKVRLTWDQVISLSAALGAPFAIETRSFDTLTAFFLELIWNYEGKLEVNGRYQVVNKDDNVLPLLRAMHIFAAIFKYTDTDRDQTLDPSLFHSGPGGLSDYGNWLFGRYWYSTLVDALTATRPATVPLAGAGDASATGKREFVWQPTGENGRAEVEILRMPKGHERTPEESKKLRREGKDPDGHYACWGDWSFGLLHGSENVALACDLVSNLMGALKVTERGLRGACLPTVSQFYWRYRDEPCVPANIRDDLDLPRMTFGEVGTAYLGTPAGWLPEKKGKTGNTDKPDLGAGIFRQSIFDYRHCAREIFGELLSIKRDVFQEGRRPRGNQHQDRRSGTSAPTASASRDHELVVNGCINILRGIEENRRRYIFIREAFRHDVAELTLQGADRRQHWCEKPPRKPRIAVPGISVMVEGVRADLLNLGRGGCAFKDTTKRQGPGEKGREADHLRLNLGGRGLSGVVTWSTDTATGVKFDAGQGIDGRRLGYDEFYQLLEDISKAPPFGPTSKKPSVNDTAAAS